MDKKQVQIKAAHVLLWALQIMLAATFLWAGFTKLFTPAQQLAEMWPWTSGQPLLVRIAAVADLLAALGLTLPRLLRIWPVLTVYTCYGIILLMAAAMVFHTARGESAQLWVNFLVAAMAAIILWILKKH